MNLSLQVFVPEMSISSSFPKTRVDIEREIGIKDGDNSKPLLLKLIEQVKFGPSSSSDPFQPVKAAEKWSSGFE
jgi:hypothetical protein